MFFSISACTPSTAQTTQFTASASGELDIDPNITIKINNVIAVTRPVVFNLGDVIAATVTSSAQYLDKSFYQYQLNGATQYFAVVTKNDYNIKVKAQYSSSRWYNFRPEQHKLSIKSPGLPLAPITLTPDVEITPLPVAVLAISALTLSFDSTAVGSTSVKAVTITNTGNSPLLVNNIGIHGTDAENFSVTGCTQAILAGQQCTITVVFAPTSSGSKVANLSILHNASNSPTTVALTGVATAPIISLEANYLTLPDTAVYSTNSRTFTVSNTGTAPLIISNLTVAGNNASEYTVSGCIGAVSLGASCTITVVFAPTTAGTRTATLLVAHNASGSPSVVTLTGTAIAIPVFNISSTSLNLGAVNIGDSKSGTLVITNTGNASLSISALTVASGAVAEFTASGCTSVIEPQSSCTITVTLTPTAAIARNASLLILHNAAGSPASVNLSGTGSTASGNNWAFIANALPVAQRWVSITYGAGKFVAVGYQYSGAAGTAAAYSTDGVTWSAATLPAAQLWASVAYGNGVYVAVASSTTSNVAYSTDGVNWSLGTMPVTNAQWYAVTFGNGQFVAVSIGGAPAGPAAYSTDGINWIQTSNNPGNRNSVAYGNGRFVAVGSGSTNNVAYSTDGTVWTTTTTPALNVGAFTFGNGIFVSLNGNTVLRSADGINWSSGSLPTSFSWSELVYGGGIFVATPPTINRATVVSSDGGENWVTGQLPSTAGGYWSSIAYGNGRFVAVQITTGSEGSRNIIYTN